MKASNGRLSGDGFMPRLGDTGAFRGSYPQILFPPKFCCGQKNKNLSPVKMYFASPNLKTWLQAWFWHNCVCNLDILF